ncbi:unnamed protein product [Penicillium roqueforti FM164]|uniref:Genomic scaffold, ProqFM164S01 n=1 Tax=Penicillium roqueforti (strain FM164) TaxID=1365484 RepID=W6Q4J8_PENRF|nr:unnamed protein product [Penicillium roqueforti FM164]
MPASLISTQNPSKKKVAKDSWPIYIAQTVFRHPDNSLALLFRSLYIGNPSKSIHQFDLITG